MLVMGACQPSLFSQTAPPNISYSDLESGPNSGGQNNAGAVITIYGNRFGDTQGSSYVSIGGGHAVAYSYWSDTKISFQLGAAAQDGGITVTTPSGTSSPLAFTVRAGNIYFVSTSGSDSAAGTFTAPWKTLLQARNSMQPGDITYALNGVSQTADDGEGWDASFTLRPQWCSASGNPRALVALPGATVTIGNAAGSSPGNGLRSVDFSADGGACQGNWVFSGLQFRGIDPVSLNGPSNVWRFVGNDISCPTSSGSDGGGACFETSLASNVKFYGNNVHDAGTANASALFQGVYFSTDSNHIDMGWNTVANVHGCRGVQVHSSPLGSGYPNSGYPQYDIAIHDNLIHDTQCDGIIVDTIDPSKGPVSIYNNIIYNAGKGPNNPEQTGAWNCINIPGNTENGAAGSGTVELFNNTLYACGTFTTPPYGEANAAIQEGGGNRNLYVNITNNLIQQTTTSLFPSGVPYVIAWDPTISNGGGVCAAGSACPWIQGTNNIFWGSGPAPAYPSVVNSVVADPQFVNLAQLDFHLAATSPAAAGGAKTQQTHDFDGISLGSTYPVGALALASGSSSGASVTIGVSPSTASLSSGQTQQFTATVTGSSNTAVSWSLKPGAGTISASGLYSAPASITTAQTVTVTATSSADSTKSASSTVTLTPTTNPPISVAISPTSVSLSAAQQKQFAATVSGSSNTAVKWSLSPSVGTLSASGLYSAPATVSTNQTVTVTATSVADGTKAASATVTLTAVVGVPPPPPPPPPPSNGFSISFTVANGQIQVSWTAPAGRPSGDNINVTSVGAPDWWYLSEHQVKGTSGTFTVPVPVGPGQFEFRYYLAGTNTVAARSTVLSEGTSSFSLVAAPSPVKADAPLSVKFTAPTGRPGGWDGDWIVLYPVNGSPDQPTWQGYPLGATSGTLKLNAPATPGQYVFSYLVAGNGYISTTQSQPVTVQ